MGYITRFLIERPLLTNIILVLIIILAIASMSRIKRQGMPRVDLGRMDITTIFPGASPEDVELNVTVKLEEALKGVIGIDKYISRSMESISYIQVIIDPDAEDRELIKAEIRRAIEGVSDLPDEIKDKPAIYDIKIDNRPVYEIALALPQNERELFFHAKQLKKKLLDLNFVSYVEESGIRDREIKILLDRKKMAQKEVSFDEVIQAIRLNKLRVSGGSLESYTSEKGIVTLSEFSKPEEVGNIIVVSNFVGHKIRIKDVGRVIDDFEKKDMIINYNGKHGVSLWIAKKGPVDVIKAVDKIKSVIEKYKKELAPKEMEFYSTWDDSIETKNRLSILYSNAALGFVLVIIVLFLFLDPKIAFWTAAGIPLSIAITMIALPIFGITINSISIMGMVVVLGMLVDDAIIVAESIFRAREQGQGKKEAALNGLRRVVKPVLGTIITTMIAFIPIYFIPGIVGDFSVEIPTIVIIMLAASFIEATTILPAHLGFEKKGKPEKMRRAPVGGKLFITLEALYDRLLNWSLKHKYKTLLFFLLFLIIGSGFAAWKTKVNMFPNDHSSKMWIMAEVPKGRSLDYTYRTSKKAETAIKNIPGDIVLSYKTEVGAEYDPGTDSFHKVSTSFLITLILVPATDREMTAVQVENFLRDEMKKIDTKKDIKLNFFIWGGGPPVGQPLEIQVLGLDNEDRLKIVNDIRGELKKMGLANITSNNRPGKKELRLLPDYDTIAAAQLNVAGIARTIRTAFDGTVVTHLQTPEERVPFRVILDESSGNFKNPLKDLHVRNNLGNLVPLKKLVRRVEGQSPEGYYHYNSYRSTRISATLDPKNKKITLKEAYNRLQEKYKDFEKEYPGFKLMLGGEAEKGEKFMRHILMAIGIAIITIYLLLVVQFNSFIQPAMVILAIPFGVVGISIAFGLQGIELSMMSLIGILGFTGVVINDSLIMVDFINRLQRKELDPGEVTTKEEAEEETDEETENIDGMELLKKQKEKFNRLVVTGAKIRLRPIVLTTVTTVVGLVPTAYGLIGGFDSFVSPLVMAMTWGLLVGTTSVLIIIPVFYAVFNDIKRLFIR
ncbi:MAG: efflux RND transporter permease subunit [bacterium]|nr:efflux RND transporter permease subunit [bacterium]